MCVCVCVCVGGEYMHMGGFVGARGHMEVLQKFFFKLDKLYALRRVHMYSEMKSQELQHSTL